MACVNPQPAPLPDGHSIFCCWCCKQVIVKLAILCLAKGSQKGRGGGGLYVPVEFGFLAGFLGEVAGRSVEGVVRGSQGQQLSQVAICEGLSTTACQLLQSDITSIYMNLPRHRF